MEDGRFFTAGGDGGPDVGRPAGSGLLNGLDGMRIFDVATNTWTRITPMQRTRWYPSVLRTSDEKFLIIGGQVALLNYGPTIPLYILTEECVKCFT